MNCFQLLGLEDDATPAQVTSRWRELRSTHHPDHGGDSAEFDELKRAYDQALKEASEEKPCQNCGGIGRVDVRRGFNVVQLPCAECGGTGKNQE